MTKPIFAALLAWGVYGAASHASAADGKWEVIFSVTTEEGNDVRFVYGNSKTGPVYFDSEAACKDGIEKDGALQTAKAALLAAVVEHKAKYNGADCVLDIPVHIKAPV